MFAIASVSFALFAGVVADLYDRRKVMIISNIVWGLLILAFIPTKENFSLLLVVTLLTQAADEFFNPAQSCSMPKIVGKKNLLLANSVYYTAVYGASFVGCFSAGVMLRFLGYSSVFLVAAVLVFVGALFSAALPSINRSENVSLRKLFSIVKTRLREQVNLLIRNRAVATSLVVMALFSSVPTAAGGVAPGFVEQALKIDSRDLSFVGVLPLAVGLLTGLVVLNRYGKGWRVWKSVLGFGAALLLLAATPNLRIFLANHVNVPQTFDKFPFFSLTVAVLVFFLGIFASTFAIFMITNLQRITPHKNLGRTFGTLGMLSAILTSFWVISFGAMADLFGPTVPVVLVGISAVMASFLIKYKGMIKWGV